MAESGIDLGFDLNSIDFDLESTIDFEDLLGTPKNQEFYELKSKTVPFTERYTFVYKIMRSAKQLFNSRESAVVLLLTVAGILNFEFQAVIVFRKAYM